MPELAVKMRMAPSTSSRTISGISHHFFSCLQNLRNSLNNDHMTRPRLFRILTIDKPAPRREWLDRLGSS